MAIYDDKYKATTIALIRATGYPHNEYGLVEVHDDLKKKSPKGTRVPSVRTLQRWFHKQEGSPPDNVVVEQKKALAELFEEAAYKYVNHAMHEDVVSDTTGPQAMIAAGTAVDKMRLLRGLPTEIVQIIPEVVSALQAAGEDPQQVFQRLIEAANARVNANR